jgi:hypothetical protein
VAEIAGFWSYVHADDDSVGNAVVKLAKRVMSEFELLSAEKLHLFIDRDLEWGEEWKNRIDRELQETTFFIPIITPRYFQSDECRRELVKFKSAADRFGVKQLLLPIYYVTVPEMEEPEPQDELMALVKSIQREDMRKIRLAEEWDATHRGLVNRLATKLLKISRETEGLSVPAEPADQATVPEGPSLSPDSPPAPEPRQEVTIDPGVPAPPEEDDGKLDVLAAGEDAMEKWALSVKELNIEIERIGNLAEASTPGLTSAESFAGQLAVANQLALQLDDPAERLTEIAQDYSTHLITIDPAIQTLIENARTDPALRKEQETKEFFEVIAEMVQAARSGAAGIEELIASMEAPAAVSRELRQRLRKIQTSLRNIIDGQKILDDWERQITEIMGDSGADGSLS